MKRIYLAVVVLALAGSWNVATAGGKKELAKLQGKWNAKDQDGPISYMQIKGKKATLAANTPNGVQLVEMTVSIDPTKSPKHITFKITKSPVPDLKGKMLLGIYEFSGKNLKWCSNRPGGDTRPTEFKTDKSKSSRLFMLTKAK